MTTFKSLQSYTVAAADHFQPPAWVRQFAPALEDKDPVDLANILEAIYEAEPAARCAVVHDAPAIYRDVIDAAGADPAGEFWLGALMCGAFERMRAVFRAHGVTV